MISALKLALTVAQNQFCDRIGSYFPFKLLLKKAGYGTLSSKTNVEPRILIVVAADYYFEVMEGSMVFRISPPWLQSITGLHSN
jgi:hypothetical protein